MKVRIRCLNAVICILVTLFAVPLMAEESPVLVHTSSLPENIKLPEQEDEFLYLEGEPEGNDDAWPVLSHKLRTRFRTGQVPDDKWWGAHPAPDGTRIAIRGADIDHPWHRLSWDLTDSPLKPGLYDVYARVMVMASGSCDLAFTLDDDLPLRHVSNGKSYINWVQVGTVEIMDKTRKAQLHVRTTKTAVRVDTVLLVKVEPIVIQADFKRIDLTPVAWQKGSGIVFTDTSSVLGFSSNTPEVLKNVEAAVRHRPDEAFTFQPLAVGVDGIWRVKFEQPGWYDVQVKAIPLQGVPIIHTITAAVLGKSIPEEQRKGSVFGLWNVHGDTDLIRLAGAYWNRRMMSFRDITPEEAAETVSADNAVAPYNDKDGLAYVGVHSFGMPMWTMRMPENVKMPSFGNPFYPAENWGDVVNSVAAHARSYAPLPRAFSMYNEPLAHWKGTHEELVDYARAVRDGLKSVSPDFLVGGPGLYSIRIGDLEKLAKAGILDVLDFIDMHAYVGGTMPEEDFLDNIIALNDWLEAKGHGDKPVYLTEFGWTAAPGTWQPHVERWTQAQYVARSLALGWSQGIGAMIYFVLDYRTKNTGEAAFSLIDEEGRPQPGYVTFTTVSKWFAASTPIGHYKLSPTVHLVIGHRDNKLQMGLWSTEGTENICLPFKLTQVIDMMGRSVSVEKELAITPDPIFLEAIADGLTGLHELDKIEGSDPGKISDPDAFWPVKAMESSPASLRSGDYAVFSRRGTDWQIRPFKLLAPIHTESLKFEWRAGESKPQITATLQSNTPDVTVTDTVWLAEKPDKKVQIILPPNGRRIVHFVLNDAVPGRKSSSIFCRQGTDEKPVEQSVEWTALEAVPAGKSGKWADFTDWAPFGKLDNAPGFDDCRGSLRIAHSSDGLHLEVRVIDDEHHQLHAPESPDELWKHDSLQIGFDMDALSPWEAGFAGADTSHTLGGHRVFEFAVASSSIAESKEGIAYLQTSYDNVLPAGTARPEVKVQVAREKNVTSYNIFFPWTQLGVSTPMKAGEAFGFSLAVNDVDPSRKAQRHGIRLFDGIVQDKNPRQYGLVWLR
ncbi:MAG: hypothetical protein GX804_08105 [Lentisphaerae bacterium]|nr:hypothetical protein [Lentisphaerota bacterium]